MNEANQNEPLANADATIAVDAPRSGRSIFHFLLSDPVARFCAAYLILLVSVALTVDLWVPYPPELGDASVRLSGPSSEHWLGTDELGRDLLSRVLIGTQIAIMAPLIAVSIAFVLGVTVGLAAGYYGSWVDRVAMRSADALQSVPLFLIAFAVVGAFGNSLVLAMAVVGLVLAASYARLARAVSMSVREKSYIDAAKVLGYRDSGIILRHVLPNSISPLVVHTTLLIGATQLIEAALSFVGIGVELGTPSWGSMLKAAPLYQDRQPLMSIVPGLLITATVLACNLLSDSLQRAFSGKTKAKRRRHTARAPAAVPQASASTEASEGPLLSMQNVEISFPRGENEIKVVEDFSLDLKNGDTFGLVGESGSGKSMVLSAIMNLIPGEGRVSSGRMLFDGRDLIRLSASQLSKVRGPDIAVISQDPMAALSPVHTVGKQISEGLRVHYGLSRREAWRESVRWLDKVGVADAARRVNDYPFQFSGGMAQRVMIAAALACRPKLLLADEPTTALDVRVQAQVLNLIDELRQEMKMTLVLVSHDLGVIAETCERIGVMYGGELVETGLTAEVLRAPRHPYTAALLDAMPSIDDRRTRLATIPGSVPAPWQTPPGCRFAPRCAYALPGAEQRRQLLLNGVRCERASNGELELGR